MADLLWANSCRHVSSGVGSRRPALTPAPFVDSTLLGVIEASEVGAHIASTISDNHNLDGTDDVGAPVNKEPFLTELFPHAG